MSPRLLASALLVLAACGTTTRFVATNPSPRPLKPKAAHLVHIYTTGAPEAEYVEVGILQARQESGFSTDDMPSIIRQMRGRAGAIGCDALIINGAADKQSGSVFISNDKITSSSHTLEGFWGACIVYLDADAPAATVTR
jgi:hypothetical protein